MPSVTKLSLGKSKITYPAKEVYAWHYENILSEIQLKNLTAVFEKKFDEPDINWDKTLYSFNGRVHGSIRQRTMGEQRYVKIFDITQDKEYYYQTADTVFQWGQQQLAEKTHPAMNTVIQLLLKSEPMAAEYGKWICHRAHINNMYWDQILAIHVDTDPALYNVDLPDSKQFSCTVYLDELTKGGQLWADTEPDGFVYTPRANTAIMFNGATFTHGVNCNQDEFKRIRKAYTMRFAHVDTLLLPGHPDRFLYKPVFPDQVTA